MKRGLASVAIVGTAFSAFALLTWKATHRDREHFNTQPQVPASVSLTYSLAANARFAEEITTELPLVNERLKNRLCIPIQPGLSVVPPATCPMSADQSAIVHAIVLRDGVIWRFYSSAPVLFDKPVSFGSIAKAVLGVPYSIAQGAAPSDGWCRRYFAGFQNADGSRGYADCTVPGATVPARTALAKSDNLAMLWRLRQAPPGELESTLKALDVAGVPDDYPAALFVAMGIAELTPRQVLETFDALNCGIATRAAFVQHATAPPTQLAVWAAQIASQESASAAIRTFLGAVTERGGTAAHLQALLPPDALNVTAKTGTPVNADRLDTGKALVVSFSRGGHRYTALFAVLAPKPSSPISPHLNTTDFAPLHKILLSHMGDDR